MNPAAAARPALQVLAAYLLGGVPFAYLAGRLLRGLDLRRHGSGNLGATNVFRVLGPGPGAAVLLADTSKGLAAVLLVPRLIPAPAPEAWPCALGLAAVLGHSFTPFLGFKGGKGVATSLGVFLGLAPWAILCSVALFGLAFGLTRMVSAGSLAAAAGLPLFLVSFGEVRPWGAAPPAAGTGWIAGRPVLALGMGLAALVWLRHVPNIRRILAGTENRVGAGGGGRA